MEACITYVLDGPARQGVNTLGDYNFHDNFPARDHEAGDIGRIVLSLLIINCPCQGPVRKGLVFSLSIPVTPMAPADLHLSKILKEKED